MSDWLRFLGPALMGLAWTYILVWVIKRSEARIRRGVPEEVLRVVATITWEERPCPHCGAPSYRGQFGPAAMLVEGHDPGCVEYEA